MDIIVDVVPSVALLRENLNLLRCSDTIGERGNILRENLNLSKSKLNNDGHDYRSYFDTILQLSSTTG